MRPSQLLIVSSKIITDVDTEYRMKTPIPPAAYIAEEAHLPGLELINLNPTREISYILS